MTWTSCGRWSVTVSSWNAGSGFPHGRALSERGNHGAGEQPAGGNRSERWARVNFPNKFVHPHEYTARDGCVFDKMFVSIPPGVTLNGVDLGGYAFDHFAKPREIEQKANGRPVAINFRPGEPVRLFKGTGAERRTLEVSNPWDLCRAVKAHNDEYAKSRQEAAVQAAEDMQSTQERPAAGVDEFDTFDETGLQTDGYTPCDPADPTMMSDTSAGMGATL